PSGVATTGVPRGAGRSIASWTRPFERDSLNVSRSCSGRTPATGITSLLELESSCAAGGGGCGEGDGVTRGVGFGVGWRSEIGGLSIDAGARFGDVQLACHIQISV